MSWKPYEEEKISAIIPLKGTAIRGGDPQKRSKGSLGAMLRVIWGWLRGNTEVDVGRMREGGVQIVEGKGRMAIAEAEAKLGEAANLHADAELKRAQAVAVINTSEAEATRAKAAALRDLAEAVSILRQNGGDVFFDLDEIKRTVFEEKERPRRTVITKPDVNQVSLLPDE